MTTTNSNKHMSSNKKSDSKSDSKPRSEANDVKKSDANHDKTSDAKRSGDNSKSDKTDINADVKRAKNKKSKPNKHLYMRPDPFYNVYLVYYNSILPLLKFEVGLLIATDERIIRKGHYYEVKGPRLARGYKDRAEYHLYYSIIKSPENSMYFRKIAHIGKMKESKLYLALRIAEQIPPPQVALSYRGEPPNCIDWMNNFLFELARFKIMVFDTDFETPKEKRLLVHPSLLTPDELASIGMDPKLSNRYIPPSMIGSKAKRTNDQTESKNAQPSSKQDPSSSKNEPSSKPATSSSKQASSSSRQAPSSSKHAPISSRQAPSSSKHAPSSSKHAPTSSKKPKPSSANQPSSAKVAEPPPNHNPSSSEEQSSPQHDKSGAASKSGRIPSSSKQGKDESKHKHLSFRRFFSKK